MNERAILNYNQISKFKNQSSNILQYLDSKFLELYF